jgi:hypothetical protein
LAQEKNGGPSGIKTNIRFEDVGDPKDCFVQIGLGDLLHISAYESRQKGFGEMMIRVEKLVKACIPSLDAAAESK